jgi:hypothetical protein
MTFMARRTFTTEEAWRLGNLHPAKEVVNQP